MRKQTIPEMLAIGQRDLVRMSYVCGHWGKQERLDQFLQIYAVEKAKIEARRNGYSVSEQPLEDGSIKVTINTSGGDL